MTDGRAEKEPLLPGETRESVQPVQPSGGFLDAMAAAGARPELVDRLRRDVIGQKLPDGSADTSLGATGQQNGYWVLSAAERAKGFVRPVRRAYKHVGARPRFATRPLTAEEAARHGSYGYVAYEEYPPSERPGLGRFWTAAELQSGCGAVTRMGIELSETYARDPGFYSGTFCVGCKKHFPVGKSGEFVWEGTDERVGT